MLILNFVANTKTCFLSRSQWLEENRLHRKCVLLYGHIKLRLPLPLLLSSPYPLLLYLHVSMKRERVYPNLNSIFSSLLLLLFSSLSLFLFYFASFISQIRVFFLVVPLFRFKFLECYCYCSFYILLLIPIIQVYVYYSLQSTCRSSWLYAFQLWYLQRSINLSTYILFNFLLE